MSRYDAARNRSAQNRAALRANATYLYGAEVPAERPLSSDRSEIGYVPGRRTAPEIQTLSSQVMGMVKVIAIAACAIALLCVVRIGLATESVQLGIESKSLTTQIESVRSLGNDLEVQQSRLANSVIIRSQAARLGMAAPETTTLVSLADDVVVVNEAGDLSLSGSLSAIASQG